MENVLVCLSNDSNTREVKEYLRNLGYEPVLVQARSELLSGKWGADISKLFLEVRGVSDILFLHSLRSVFERAEIILIVSSQLNQIISILGGNNYRTLTDITNLSYKSNA